MNQLSQRLTLAEATTLPQSEWDSDDGGGGIQITGLVLTNGERQRTAALWQWLCDAHPSSEAGARVGIEVLKDGPLTIALNLPAIECLHWLRVQERWLRKSGHGDKWTLCNDDKG